MSHYPDEKAAQSSTQQPQQPYVQSSQQPNVQQPEQPYSQQPYQPYPQQPYFQQSQQGYPDGKLSQSNIQHPQQAYVPSPSQQQPYYSQPAAAVRGSSYPGAAPGPPTVFWDPLVPRPGDILPLNPAIIQRRQIAASLPPCPCGGYHELRNRYVLGWNTGTFMSIICFPIVCCCVKDEVVCIKCGQKFDVVLPAIN